MTNEVVHSICWHSPLSPPATLRTKRSKGRQIMSLQKSCGVKHSDPSHEQVCHLVILDSGVVVDLLLVLQPGGSPQSGNYTSDEEDIIICSHEQHEPGVGWLHGVHLHGIETQEELFPGFFFRDLLDKLPRNWPVFPVRRQILWTSLP